MGDVYEVNVRGYKLSHKRMVMELKLDGKERKEIDTLKAIPKHHHIMSCLYAYKSPVARNLIIPCSSMRSTHVLRGRGSLALYRERVESRRKSVINA
jgi:hypothetical protein